jgi:hypothetical protein
MNLLRLKTIQYTIIIVFFLVLFIASPLISAQDLYADVKIDITDSGFVTIEGETNYPELLVDDNQNYTSKIKDNWFFNFTKEEIFSEFIFKLLLPPSSSIYSVDSSGSVWIGEESNRLVVYGLGQNNSFSLVIQYQITQSSDIQETPFFNTINIVLSIILIVIVILIFFNLHGSLNKKQVSDKTSFERIKGLTDRQKKIMKLLGESPKPLTQTAIEKELDMPKAAVSRNIHSLEQKGLIEIEKVGMSNFIHIKKQ